MFTVLVTCEEGPLQPLAVTWILTVPKNPLAQVMTPVVAPMLPAEGLLRLQLKPVLLVAVVVYVVVVVPLVSWQEGSTPADTVIAVGVPTVGVTLTVLVTMCRRPVTAIGGNLDVYTSRESVGPGHDTCGSTNASG
jgi:hypothetical protein